MFEHYRLHLHWKLGCIGMTNDGTELEAKSNAYDIDGLQSQTST